MITVLATSIAGYSPVADKPSSALQSILQLRLLIGYLGEKAQFAWWPSSFFDQSSRLFLEPAFPRTLRTAQYHGVVEAARRFHDEHLSAGAFHLFRLPEEMEQDLHTAMQSLDRGSSIYSPDNEDSALGALQDVSGSATVEALGPASVGSVSEIYSRATLQGIAAVYRSSFLNNERAFPYLLP
nr:BrxE family protein [Sphingomonas kaistensis]